MTQNTQTTAVWIESILETELSLIPLMVGVDADSADIGGMDAAARIIAVRIDRLTAERDEAQRLIGIYGTSRDAVIAQLGTEIDRLTAERDGLKAALAASWPNLSAQLSEARAEVERLRPAAEAWETLEASLYADANADSYAETGYMRHKAEAAAARARAAKESQP